MLLFTLVIEGNKQFFFVTIYLLIVLSTLFNGTKIIIYNTICAFVSVLGLLVYRKFFWAKSKAGYLALFLLNLLILVLTVKRSAVFAIVPSFLMYLFFIRRELNFKKLLITATAIGFITILTLVIWYAVNGESLKEHTAYVLNKLSVHEKNTSWRLEAWKIGWQKFKESPIFGIGYGPKIIELPVDNVNTNDPHNSILAFLIRHGILMFSLYMFFIARTFKIILDEIKSSANDSIQRNNSIFIFLGLAAMVVFAFFNVVFENQYEGIFFYFFLSAIYIIKSKDDVVKSLQTKTSKYISNFIITTFLGFILFAFSPYNQISVLPIYSSKTNYSLPAKLNCDDEQLTYISGKNKGITLQKNDGGASPSFPELLWFFPPQANKLDLKNYSLVLESDSCLNYLFYAIEYEDQSRIPLQYTIDNTSLKFNLNTMAKYQDNKAKPKFFIISFPTALVFKNITIKNIYISYNK